MIPWLFLFLYSSPKCWVKQLVGIWGITLFLLGKPSWNTVMPFSRRAPALRWRYPWTCRSVLKSSPGTHSKMSTRPCLQMQTCQVLSNIFGVVQGWSCPNNGKIYYTTPDIIRLEPIAATFSNSASLFPAFDGVATVFSKSHQIWVPKSGISSKSHILPIKNP